MTTYRNLIYIIVVLFISCTEKIVKKEVEETTPPSSILNSESKESIDTDYIASANAFAMEVLGGLIRTDTFTTFPIEKPNHLNIFQTEGLEKIVGYSKVGYPQKTTPNQYQHFILFVATYKNQEAAQNNFNQLKTDSKYGFTDLKHLDKAIAERVKKITFEAKYGGMIVHKGKYIFSLVETCREAPMTANWEEYEAMFIQYITAQNEEIEVLNANCGNDRYYLEIKTSDFK
ncbi:hypothetical protein [uncultured Dokdonia sp.]|uniref:hypothetical protein n=1 Tax=uncultured Dokdonia sp. TaxID=575653 RepID=UPI00261C4477|nr:hypothetical protein [uncultured Dokdonia sp.]